MLNQTKSNLKTSEKISKNLFGVTVAAKCPYPYLPGWDNVSDDANQMNIFSTHNNEPIRIFQVQVPLWFYFPSQWRSVFLAAWALGFISRSFASFYVLLLLQPFVWRSTLPKAPMHIIRLGAVIKLPPHIECNFIFRWQIIHAINSFFFF